MARFAVLGLLSLESRHIVLERDDGKLVLAGITDRAVAPHGKSRTDN